MALTSLALLLLVLLCALLAGGLWIALSLAATGLALDRGVGGALVGPSSWFMKSPPQQFDDEEARERTRRFVAGED